MRKQTKKNSTRFQAHKKRIHRLRHHPFVIPVLTFLALFIITIAGLISISGVTVGPGDARIVQVFVDGKEQTLPTRASTVGDLLKRLDITLGEKDIVEPSLDTPIIEDDFKVNVYRAKPVTIVDGDKKVTVLTTSSSPERIAKDAGFVVYPEDKMEPTLPGDTVRDGVVGLQYTVDRAPVVTLNLYGSPVPIRTQAKTVSELLKEKEIKLQPNDTIQPSLDSPIVANSVVAIANINKQVVIVEEAIAMPIEYIDDPTLAKGSNVVKQAGSPGKNVVTYELKLENGKEVARTKTQEVHVSDPVKQIVSRGTKVVTLTGSKAEWMAAAGISQGDYQYVDFIIGHESGWRPNAVSANRCIGLGQKCNAQSLINACPNWQTDPVCQLQHFSGYAGRYGGWQGAYNFWQVNHWW